MKELVVENKDIKVEVGVNIVIDSLVVPTGSDVASIVKNYNSVKEKIKAIKDNNGSEVKPGNNSGRGLGGSSGGSSGGGNNTDKNFNLSIMHMNDTHANLENVAKTVTAVQSVREQKPDSLLLHAGDVFSGTLYFNEYKGQADLEFMNLMGSPDIVGVTEVQDNNGEGSGDSNASQSFERLIAAIKARSGVE